MGVVEPDGNEQDATEMTRKATVVRSNGAVPLATTVETSAATVLFVDLRGYTALAEQLPPLRVAVLLDEFFQILTRATERHSGQVFHMAGDAMMAGFGLLNPAGPCACEALAAGHAMLRAFAPLEQRWREELSIETGIGIGLHLGEVALGFYGPTGRQSPTLVGDTVNVAARLCGRARAGEVLFSSAVAEALDAASPQSQPTAAMQIRHLPKLRLRGRSALIDIWCVPAVKRIAL